MTQTSNLPSPFDNATFKQGMSLVEDLDLEGVRLPLLKGKELGLQIMQLGMAEAEAMRIKRLAPIIDLIEKEIFDPEKIKRLSTDEKIERYTLALQQVANSSNFIKATTNSLDWNSIELQLMTLQKIKESGATATTTASADKAKLGDMAAKILNDLALSANTNKE